MGYVNNVKKEIIAFANCQGGLLYVGVRENREIIGVDNPDKVMQQIGNMIRDAIKPDVTMFVNYKILEQKGRYIIEV